MMDRAIPGVDSIARFAAFRNRFFPLPAALFQCDSIGSHSCFHCASVAGSAPLTLAIRSALIAVFIEIGSLPFGTSLSDFPYLVCVKNSLQDGPCKPRRVSKARGSRSTTSCNSHSSCEAGALKGFSGKKPARLEKAMHQEDSPQS